MSQDRIRSSNVGSIFNIELIRTSKLWSFEQLCGVSVRAPVVNVDTLDGFVRFSRPGAFRSAMRDIGQGGQRSRRAAQCHPKGHLSLARWTMLGCSYGACTTASTPPCQQTNERGQTLPRFRPVLLFKVLTGKPLANRIPCWSSTLALTDDRECFRLLRLIADGSRRVTEPVFNRSRKSTDLGKTKHVSQLFDGNVGFPQIMFGS